MPSLVLGPMLRYVDETSATIWVETDSPCTVTCLGHSTDTFTVHGRHYALVEIEGLEPGTVTSYTVELDADQVWPPDEPVGRSVIRTVSQDGGHRLMFGSCRVSAPHDDTAVDEYGIDTLYAYAKQLLDHPDQQWPDALIMLGDQVYADHPPEEIREYIRSRRDTSEPPGEEIADFDEYARLYHLAWSEPTIRWLLSTLPTMSIFDDHDLRDDWNTSHAWRQTMGRLEWWRRRVVAGLSSYWVYQHLGNLSPSQCAEDKLLTQLREHDGDGAHIIDEFSADADVDPSAHQWSYARDFGDSRLIVLDSRCARVLTPGARRMIDDVEWDWFMDQAVGDVDHLIIGSSVPVLLPMGLHYVESWNEAVADGVWGRHAAQAAEKIRQAIDLEHWGAFRDSFKDMSRVVAERAKGQRGRAPQTISFLSGDVHYSYLAKARIKGAKSHVYQLVCSPIRNPLSDLLRLANVAASFIGAGMVGYGLARLAGVHRTPFPWRVRRGPWFDNSIATLDLDGREATVSWHSVKGDSPDTARLRTVGVTSLTGGDV